jgi:hypothetical protein
MDALLGEPWLATDAPWYIRVRAWIPEAEEALVLHWVNYRQDEGEEEEAPIRTDPFHVDVRVPVDWRVTASWHTPEEGEGALAVSAAGRRVSFEAPPFSVYGVTVLRRVIT